MDCGTWKIEAEARQQEINDLVVNYDWELYEKQEREYLEKKVEYILYGPSQNALDEDTKTLIKNITEKIIKEAGHGENSRDETCMAFIYVFWSVNGETLQAWPVFKVPKDESRINVYFIDVNSRVYENWKDFLQNNQFPPCEYCYPTGGEYTTNEDGVVVLEFGKSPASSKSKSVIKYLDYANSGLALGTTAVAAASIFLPVAGPLLQASVWITRGISAYGAMRSGSTLYDRGTHKQSLGLKDGESRGCWLSIGGSVLGAAASSARSVTSKMAQTGQVMGRVGCTTVNSLTVGSVAVNGLGLLHSLPGLVDRYKKKQLSHLDVFQFSASLLLFAHAAVNVETAQAIIEKTQNGVLQDFENNLRSNRHRRMFRKVVRNTRDEQNSIKGNAQVIRSLKHVNNVDDFFSALVRMDKQFRPTQSKVTFTEGGLIQVNENLSVDPTRLVLASKEQRILLLEATKRYAGSQISETEFKSMTEAIIGKTPSPVLGGVRPLSFKELLGLGQPRCKSVQKIGSEFSYPLLSAYERMELMTILKKFSESDHEQILRIASVLSKALGLTSGQKYVEIAYFVCGLIRNISTNSRLGETANAASCSMSCTEYCQAALQEFSRDPSKLVHIFSHVKSLFDVLSERNTMPTQFRHIGLFEIAQLASILLVMNQPLWLSFIQFAEEVFCILRLRKAEKILNVVKGLCLSVQKMLMDMERKHYNSIADVPNIEQIWKEAAKERSRNNVSSILNTITEDAEIHQSVIEEIQRDHVLQISPTSVIPSMELKYTKQQPLVLNRCFWFEGQLQLLSEEEILDVCKQSLDSELWPEGCNVEYDGSNIFVNVDDKLVVIECDFDGEKLSAYINTAATL